ncbi:hypothetical protein OO010_10860 [Flavobacteriaceae bacterium KMM 6898]|nr:hypothetical protein [Flavobacteriaceae bacterium KMM 6898]
MRGFVILGTILDKYLIKFSAVLLIILSLVFYGYDMMSIYYPIMDVVYVLISSSILFGLSVFIFGYALLKLDEFLGIWATVAGGITIAASFFLFTVFLGWLGLLFLVPAVLIQIILLSKTAHFMQLKQNNH